MQPKDAAKITLNIFYDLDRISPSTLDALSNMVATQDLPSTETVTRYLRAHRKRQLVDDLGTENMANLVREVTNQFINLETSNKRCCDE